MHPSARPAARLRPVLAALAVGWLTAGCVVGDTSSSPNAIDGVTTDTPSTTTTDDDRTNEPSEDDSPTFEPPSDARAELGLETFLATSGDARTFQFEHRVQLGDDQDFLATVTDGIVDLEAGLTRLEIDVVASSPEIESWILDSTGVEAMDELEMEVVVASADRGLVTLRFPGREAWRGRWLRIAATDVEDLMAAAGVDLDLLIGPDVLGRARTIAGYEPAGVEDGWVQLTVDPEDGVPLLSGTLRRALERAEIAAHDLRADVPGQAWGTADEFVVWLYHWQVLEEIESAAPGLVGDVRMIMATETRIYDLESPLTVDRPAAGEVSEEPFAPIL